VKTNPVSRNTERLNQKLRVNEYPNANGYAAHLDRSRTSPHGDKGSIRIHNAMNIKRLRDKE